MTVTMVTLLSLVGIVLIWLAMTAMAAGLRLLWLTVGDWWQHENSSQAQCERRHQ